VLSQNEAREIEGFAPKEGADQLVMQATGGRPPGTDDGTGDTAPDITPGIRPNGGAAAP
jgi:hypothetical protein